MTFLVILLIVIAGVVAAFLFASAAKKKGYPAKRARIYPLVLMLAVVFVCVTIWAATWILGNLLPQLQALMASVFLVAGWFFFAVYLVILRKAYRNIQTAPDADVAMGQFGVKKVSSEEE